MAPANMGTKACSICHQKKIKCDLADGTQPCNNCRLGDYICRPHQRKRKRYTLSPDRQDTAIEKQLVNDVETSIDITGLSDTGDMDVSRDSAVGGSRHSHQAQVQQPLSSRTQSSNNGRIPVTAKNSYVGYDEYLGAQVPLTETKDSSNVPREPPIKEAEIEGLDMQILQLRKALDMPPRVTRESLIDAFMERCHPWMPILDRRWLEHVDGQRRPSLLLSQAVFLAGSRVTSSPLLYNSSADFYERARALFFLGHEKNTTLAIVAVCLLQWWNPTGPEKFSTDTSGFWVRIGTELAYQVGLHKEPAEGPFRTFRRRLWWTLVSRDSVISVGTGRPRTINIADSDISPPTTEDFDKPDLQAHLFVAYVSICRQLGDIAEAQRRRTLHNGPTKKQLENSLFRWVSEIPPALRIVRRLYNDEGTATGWSLAPYNFEARQLMVPYFVSLILLNRSSTSPTTVPTASLMASSYVVSILEEFLSRDQLRYLGPAFAFYALAAGIVQIVGFRHETLQDVANREFRVIQVALEELGKRWGSAQGASRALNRAKRAMQRQPYHANPPLPLFPTNASFFNDFGPDLCSIWDLGFPTDRPSVGGSAVEAETYQPQASLATNAVMAPLPLHHDRGYGDDTFGVGFTGENGANGNLFDLGGTGSFNDPLANSCNEASWLFHDFDLQSILSSAFDANS